jgi:hypothetical protein
MICAADPAATIGDEPSQRPFQTVIPVAERLPLRIVTDYAVGRESELTNAGRGFLKPFLDPAGQKRTNSF